jgi:hypothetical protein
LFGTGVYEDKEERETFFVTPSMREALVGEIRPVLLVPTITRQSVLLLWPLKLPMEGQRHNPWAETAREAAELAKTKWVRLAADMGLGGYRFYQAEGDLSEPVWPDKPLTEIMRIAFRDTTPSRTSLRTTNWSAISCSPCSRPWQRLRRRKSATARRQAWPERGPRESKSADQGSALNYVKKSPSGLLRVKHLMQLPSLLASTGTPPRNTRAEGLRPEPWKRLKGD